MTNRNWHTHARTLLVVAMTAALVLWAPAASIGPAIGTAAAQESGPPQTPAAYYGNVTIDGEPAPAGTTIEAVVNGSVVGSITIDEPGRYGGPDALDEKLTVGGNTTIENGTPVHFYVDNDAIARTRVTTTDPETVRWEAGDVRRVDLRAAVGDPLFEVDIVDVPDNVTAGSDIPVTLNITNVGAADGRGTVTVSVDGEARGNTTETLGVGEHTETLVTVPTTLSDAGTVTVAADSGDDTAAATVNVTRPPDFTVDLSLNDTSVTPGEYVNGTVNVTNTGGLSDTQNLTIEFGGTVLKRLALALAPGEHNVTSFAYLATPADAGTRTVTAATADDSTASLVSVSRPASFDVDVIEGESNLDVVAGENATLVAEIENTGGATATKTVNVTRNDTVLESASLALDPGEVGSITATNATQGDDVPGFDLTVATPDDTETEAVTVSERDAFLDVTVTGAPANADEPLPGNVTNLTVDAKVTNLGTEPVTQTIQFRVDGHVRNTSTVDLGGTNSTTLTGVRVPIHPGSAPAVDLVVASGDDTASRTVDVDATAAFDVTIVDRTNRTQLDTEDPFAPTINVTNVGEQSGNGTLRVRFNGSVEAKVSVDALPGGETKTVVAPGQGFALNASSPGTKILEADVINDGTGALDDVSTRPVSVGAAPNFTVKHLSVTPSGMVEPGTALSLEATINNTGGTAGNQTVVLEFGDTTVTASVLRLAPGETETISGTYGTRAADAGSRTVSVSTDDDAETRTLTVLADAQFEVTNVDLPGSVVAGTPADVTVTVENVGGLAGNTTTLRLYAGGTEVGNASVTLGAGESRLVEFDGGEVTPSRAGTLRVTAATGDDAESGTLTVGEPGRLDLRLLSLSDPVTTEGTLRATVRARNVGDGKATETVSLKLGGTIVDTATVTVAGGKTTVLTLSHPISRTLSTDEVSATVEVDGANDELAQTVTIRRPPTDPDFRVSGLSAPARVLETGQIVNVTADVTNIGETAGTQTIELVVADEVRDTTNLGLGNGSTKTVELSFNTTDVGVGANVSYAVRSANQSAAGTITIVEPTPGTAEIVSTELLSAQAAQGERFRVNVTVENVGDRPLTAAGAVELDYRGDGSTDDTARISGLGPGNTTTVTLGVVPPAEPRAGVFDRSIELRANDSTATRTVPVDFGGIQSGIDALGGGEDTVLVADGTYEERNAVRIATDGVTLAAADPGSMPTITTPRQETTALIVNASDVRVANLRFAGDGTGTAISLAGDNATLTNVYVANWSTGIAETAGTNRVVGSTVVESGVGIRLDGAGGSTIEFTRVARSGTKGIHVLSPNNTIFGVSVSGSNIGVDIQRAEGNEIRQSIVRGNDDIGVRVSDVPGNVSTGDPSAVIRNSALEANGVEAFIANSSVNGSHNWWGTSARPVEGVDYVVRSTLTTTDPLTSRPKSQFGVSASLPGDVVRGETFSVSPTIENTGTKSDLQEVQLVVDGTVVDSTDVSLGAGDSTEVSLSYAPDITDGDTIDLAVRSLDDSESRSPVGVLEPASFAVPALDVPTTVSEGEAFDVVPTVENTGGATATRAVELLVNGTQVATTQVTLGGGNTATPPLTYTPDADDVGTINVTVAAGDAVRTAFVTVEAAAAPPETPTAPADGDDDGAAAPAPDVTPAVEPIAVESVTPTLQDGRRVATFETVESVQSIALQTTETVGEISVARIDPADSPVPEAPGTTQTLQNISVPADAEDIAATITFGVSADAVGDPAALRAFRYSEGAWRALDTRVVEATGGTIVLEAETPGFSYFAVSEVSQPDAAISIRPTPATVGSDVTLSAAGSSVEAGEIVAYEWTVDGESHTGETVTITFEDAGEYTVELTVRTDANATDTTTETLVVEPAQTATVTPTETATATPTEQPPQEPGGFNLVAVLAVLLLLAAGYVLYRQR
ncbi:MAG: CARDB domain-containing protein [Haloquadratum sp.]